MTTVTDEMVDEFGYAFYGQDYKTDDFKRIRAALEAALSAQPHDQQTGSGSGIVPKGYVRARVQIGFDNGQRAAITKLAKANDRSFAAQVRALVDTALAATPAVTVPEGWQLVPKEPTDEMRALFVNVHGENDFYDAYAAMLAAAPSPDQQPKEVAEAWSCWRDQVRKDAYECIIDHIDHSVLHEDDANLIAKAIADCIPTPDGRYDKALATKST